MRDTEDVETAPSRSQLLVFVRHGAIATDAPPETVFDPPLSENGRAQAEAVGSRLTVLGIDACITSPLRRARETAEAIVGQLESAPSVEVVDSLAEYSRGDLEGVIRPEAKKLDSEFAKYWRDGDWEAWPNGDTREAFRARTDLAMAEVQGRGSGAFLVVTHGGVINELLCSLLGITRGGPTLFHPPVSSVTIVQSIAQQARLFLFGDLWHLEDAIPAVIAYAGERESLLQSAS